MYWVQCLFAVISIGTFRVSDWSISEGLPFDTKPDIEFSRFVTEPTQGISRSVPERTAVIGVRPGVLVFFFGLVMWLRRWMIEKALAVPRVSTVSTGEPPPPPTMPNRLSTLLGITLTTTVGLPDVARHIIDHR
jgi:hypothetical protein